MATRTLFFALFIHAVLADSPQVAFDRMGTVGLAGAFTGLDFFQNESATQAFDPTTSSLFSRDTTGALTRLTSTNPGGRISVGCTLKNTIYFAGSFSSIGGTSVKNIASFTPSSSAFVALGEDGPNGEINTMLCDSKENKIWVGGSFSSPGSNVAVWDLKSETWSRPPFVGLASAQAKVLSITTNASDSSIFFAGSFITTFQGDGSPASNHTSNSNVPPSAGATPFSFSLVPIPLQSAEVNGSPSSLDPQFSNIKAILCPSGSDGPGNSWLAADSNTAVVTIRTFKFMSVNGVRLGNTFVSNRGTTGFSLTTIPDNKLQTLRYLDPMTGQTQACSDPCPLSADSSLLYQDFLFDNTLTITGVQIKLSKFSGVSPGLHILQLLSSGAFASSIDADNGPSCYAPSPSNTTRTGEWVAKVANTDIAGTLQTVLVSTVRVGTSSASGPIFTWMPYVSASGNYDINLLVPGCTDLQDCASRTTVKITVFPGDRLEPWVTTVSQQNPTDVSMLIYSGPVLPSTPKFAITISMTLADDPAGSGEGGRYELVADRVQLVLKSTDESPSGVGGGQLAGAQGTIRGFGIFEFPRNLSSTEVDATKTLPNSSLTFLDGIGTGMFKGAGGIDGLSFANPSAIAAVVHHTDIIFLGGNFTLSSGVASGAANIVAYKGGSLVRLANKGLNGHVTSFLVHGDTLFVGGSFSDTLEGSTGGRLRGIAMYNIRADEWTPLDTGVDGGVTSLGMANGQVVVAGNFSRLLASADGGSNKAATGLATWDLKRGSWVNSGGFVLGSMSWVGNGTSSMQLIAGNVKASYKYGASGMVFLENGGKNEGPRITPLKVSLGFTQDNTSSTVVQRRSPISRASVWIKHVQLSKLFPRQTPSTQLPPLPLPPPAPAPAVLTGAFWTNATSSTQTVIIGGNFSFDFPTSPSLRGVALYDPSSGTVQALKGAQLNGTVYSLLVDGSQLYIGGEFTIQGASVNGLAAYDLSKQQWRLDTIPALQRNTAPPIVRSITKSTSKPDTLIVAGSFSQAGSLECHSVCAYDISSKQWNKLGNGIQGEVASIAYAGSNQEILVVSGSIALPDSTLSNVAQFSILNTTWSAVGSSSDLPGPVSAIEVNNGNASSIFAAGRSADGSSFLSFWNGIHWSILGSTLQGDTTISQLMMVPLQDEHSANGIIEPDRMLMISGSLTDSSFGNISSALYDGQSLFPYIVTSAVTGLPGAVASLFWSFASINFNHRRVLATGVVILISIAIAAGLVFLLALIGILWTLLSRRDNGLGKLDAADDDDDDSAHHRPSSLLEHINAATRSTILGATLSHNVNGENEEEKIVRDMQDPFAPDASNYIRAETPSDAVGGILAEETSRPAHARYSFDGAAEGELPIATGAEVEVLDDRDPAWWYARDVRTGREGVVPAAFLY